MSFRPSVASGEISPGYVSDTLCTTPRSVRSPASTLRKACSKSLKHRTRVEGAGKGEFAFTECRNFNHSLAQNRGFCAKEEPQAQNANKAGYTCLVAKRALRRRGALLGMTWGGGSGAPQLTANRSRLKARFALKIQNNKRAQGGFIPPLSATTFVAQATSAGEAGAIL